jgi:hypothetical protein
MPQRTTPTPTVRSQLSALASKQNLAKHFIIFGATIGILVAMSDHLKKTTFAPGLLKFCEANNKTCNQYIIYQWADDDSVPVLTWNSSMQDYLTERVYWMDSAVATLLGGLIVTIIAYGSEALRVMCRKTAQSSGDETRPLLNNKASIIQKSRKPLRELLELSLVIYATIMIANAFRSQRIKSNICDDFLYPEYVQQYQVNPTCNQLPNTIPPKAIDLLETYASDTYKAMIQASAIQGMVYVASLSTAVFGIFCLKRCLEPRAHEPTKELFNNPTYGML